VNPDWTFQATVPAGLGWLLRVVAPKGFETEAIRLSRRDVVDRPILIDANIAGVEVSLTGNTAIVTGSVANSAAYTSSACVIAFSVTEERWTPFSRHIKRTTIDAAERFTVDGLLEGEYAFVAVARLEDGEETNPGVLRALLPLAVKVRVTGGQNTEIAVPMTSIP
jgi:hypothetical protein